MNADDGVLLSGCQAPLDYICLGAGLPPDAERELRLAGMSYHEDEVAEAHLQNALNLAPWHVAVHIGLYRFYFYKGRLQEALRVAANCLEDAAARIGIAGDWREVRAQDAEFGSYEAVLPRFYLFTLKAYAYLQMRLGDLGMGRAATVKLLELDPQDKLGGKVLLSVLERVGRDGDED
jgi:tetratricopeptide (TPR) repeat protein